MPHLTHTSPKPRHHTVLQRMAEQLSERLLIWGIFSRGLALIYAISFLSLIYCNQVVALAGKRGISPLSNKLRAITSNGGKLAGFLRFPTLFWFNSSDATLTVFPIVGLFLSLVTMIGGVWTPATFGIIWIIYLSLDLPVGLKFPWDSLLLEAGFLAQLLPATQMLTSFTDFDLSSVHLPPAGVAWLYRLLLVRVMVGFGRVKFEGHKPRDNCYTQGFLISQPMPSILGWFGSHLPLIFHNIAIAGMFFIELILPWGIFFTGTTRFASAAGIASLMVGIQLTGNFGYFNLLTIVLCTASLDTVSSVTLWDEWWQDEAANQSMLAYLIVPLLFSLAVLNCLFQSWCNESWIHWPVAVHLYDFSPLLGCLGAYCRAFSPFRIVAAYGVFPPASTPALRFVTILEGCLTPKGEGEGEGEGEGDELKKNDDCWVEYSWRFMTSGAGDSTTSAPRFIAPHHPRIDHSIFYTAFGINGSNMTMSATTADPYGFNPDSSLCHRIGLRLLQGNCDVMQKCFFLHDPFFNQKNGSRRPPRQIRASLYVYVPTSISDWWSSGCTKWWTRKKVGEHMAPISLRDYEVAHEDRACAPARPETFCVDHLPSWYLKSDAAGGVLGTGDAQEEAHRLWAFGIEVKEEHFADTGLPNLNSKIFWTKFIGRYTEEERLKWGSKASPSSAAMVDAAAEVRRRFDHTELDMLKDTHSWCRTYLIRWFQHFYFEGKTGRAVRRKLLYSSVHNASFSILELVANHIIAQGKSAYQKACMDPEAALLTWGTEKLTIDSGLFIPVILHPTMFRFHARKWNIFSRIGFPPDPVKEVDYSEQAAREAEENDVDVPAPVPPEFYIWAPPWINQSYVQKALGVAMDQSMPLVVPPKAGEKWICKINSIE